MYVTATIKLHVADDTDLAELATEIGDTIEMRHGMIVEEITTPVVVNEENSN